MLQKSADPLKGVDAELEGFKPDAPWGLLVYRVTYGDHATWERMLALLDDPVEAVGHQPANKHLHPRHQFEIVNHQNQLDGATMSQLHEKSCEWVVDEYRRNCEEDKRPSVEAFKADKEGESHGYAGGARYNFFLVVDDVCLESMDQPCGPVVKLVQKAGFGEDNYTAEEIEELGPKQEDSVWEGGVTESEYENVGWMYIEVSDYVAFQERLCDPGNWEDQYLRPPQLRLQDGFEDAPGSWRRA